MTLNKLLMSLRDQFPLIPNKILYQSSLSFESIQNPFLDHSAPLNPISLTNLSLTVAPGRGCWKTCYGGQKQRNRRETTWGTNWKMVKWRKRVINLQQGFCSGQTELNLAQAGENSCSVIVITSDCHTFNFHWKKNIYSTSRSMGHD